MNRTNRHRRAIGFRRRELVGDVVEMGIAMINHGGDPNDRRSCIMALVRAGYPLRTVMIMLDSVMLVTGDALDAMETEAADAAAPASAP